MKIFWRIRIRKKTKKKHKYALIWYRKLFKENENSQKDKNKKRQYERNLYNNISKEKKTNGVNVHVKNIETLSKEKKIKSVKMLANDIEIFLKVSLFVKVQKMFFIWKVLAFNPNLGGLLGVRFEVGVKGGGLNSSPYLKLARVMLETWNLARK